MNSQKSLIDSLVEQYQTALKKRNLKLCKITNKTNLNEQTKQIVNLSMNKNNKNYLDEFNCEKNREKKSLCYKEWNCHAILCSVSKILLKTLLIRHLICKNNLGLPCEIWEIICDFIENEINFFIPAYIKFDNDINIHLDNNKIFNLRNKFVDHYNCIRNWISIKNLKFVNTGDIIIRKHYKNYSKYYFLSVIVNIYVEYGLITVIEDNERYNHHVFFRNMLNHKLYLTKSMIIKIFNFHEFLFFDENRRNKVYIYKYI